MVKRLLKKNMRARKLTGIAKLRKDVRIIKKQTAGEWGIKDVTPATQTPTSTSTLYLLSGLTNGGGATQRDGRIVWWKSFLATMAVAKHASATHTNLRAIVFYDRQPTGAAPTAAQLLDLSSVTAIFAHRNLDFRNRFKVIRDKRVQVDANFPEKYVKMYNKFNLRSVYDDSNNGDITDINSGALYLLLVADEATNSPNVDLNMRLRFMRS